MGEKLVVFDIDGTLVDDEKRLPKSTKEAILHLQNNGVYVVIATGRPPFLFEELREELGVQSYISFNGQHVVFEGETIYENPIDQQQLALLHNGALEHNVPMVFMNENRMIATTDNHPYILQCFEQLTDEYPKVDHKFHLQTPIHQALIFCKEGEEVTFTENYPAFHFLRWHKYSCDVLPMGGSKAVGIQQIVKASGLEEAHTYAFGDGANDMEMIQTVKTGIAMGNAVPQLKKVANYITSPVDDNGIVKALERYKLL